MLKISIEQYDKINSSFRKYRRRLLLKKLREENYIVSNIDDKQALEVIDQTIIEGDVLGIEQDEDIFRLAQIIFLRRSGKIADKAAAQIGAVLANSSETAAVRLDFIDRHIFKKV
jgi:hypothetical protein